MPRYALTIAYDGTDFCGWQKQEPPVPGGAGPGGTGLQTGHAGGTGLQTGQASSADSSTQPVPAPSFLKHAEPGLDAPEGRVALRTVQAVVERAVREVVREPVVLMGASRTDSGVHARGQVAAFTTTGDGGERGGWPAQRGVDRLVRAVNGRLPEDVLVVAGVLARDDFDPIGDCVAKAYSYTVHAGPTRPLWARRTSTHIYDDLDLAPMREAAACLVGERDFAAFAAAGHGRLTTVRTIFACDVREEAGDGQRHALTPRAGPSLDEPFAGLAPAARFAGPALAERFAGVSRDLVPPALAESAYIPPAGRRVVIAVSGSGFLYNMVRIIAGTLIEVGRGQRTPASVRDALASLNRRRAGPTAPAHGLCLEWIRYASPRSGTTTRLNDASIDE